MVRLLDRFSNFVSGKPALENGDGNKQLLGQTVAETNPSAGNPSNPPSVQVRLPQEATRSGRSPRPEKPAEEDRRRATKDDIKTLMATITSLQLEVQALQQTTVKFNDNVCISHEVVIEKIVECTRRDAYLECTQEEFEASKTKSRPKAAGAE